VGTPPDVLADTLQEHYGPKGLAARCRGFADLADLRRAGLTLAVVKFDLFQDHYVTVIEVTDTRVIAADPLSGLQWYTLSEFEERWRRIGVVLELKIKD
jgi:predicted double-glycine peptidase